MYFKYCIQTHAYVFQVLFYVFKTHIVDLINFTLIKIRFNVFMCFLLSTCFIIFMQDDFIHCNVNNSIILLMPGKFLSWYGIGPFFLIRSTFTTLRKKFSQDLAFIWWMPGAMYESGGFGLTLWLVYIFVSDLASTITNLGLGIWQGNFYFL